MGAISTKYNHHGDIFIEMTNITATGGQRLKGMIHMTLSTQISPSTLFLVFKGLEATSWVEDSEKQKDRHRGKSRICNFHYPLYQWKKPLPKGGYSLPFIFTLPENLPGSFSCIFEQFRASIEYKLFAKLLSKNNENLKARISIHVIEKTLSLHANLAASSIAEITTCCCIGKGISRINVVLPQDTFNTSQIVKLTAQIDNFFSRLDVIGVTCRLRLSLRLKCNSGYSFFYTQVVTSRYYPVEIPAGANIVDTALVHMRINLPANMQFLNNMHSTKGTLIRCTYCVEVEANMNSGWICCGNVPATETTVTIVPNQVAIPTLPTPPPLWNPVRMSPVELTYDSSYEVHKQETLGE